MVLLKSTILRIEQVGRMCALSLAAIMLLSCASARVAEHAAIPEKVGILVTAHGGIPEWEAAVEEAVAPLRSFCPVEVAFGMAERKPLEAAVARLEAAGISGIAVVHLFVSIESFRHEYEYLLGVRPDPPMESGQHGHAGAPLPIGKKAAIILNQESLYDSPLVGEILLERVRALSVSPENESVLILAHGVEDDAENRKWVSRIERLADHVRGLAPFRTVRVETLREDWPDKRLKAEERIRDFVGQENRGGHRVIVIPFRIFGFEPYQDVLRGLQYVADGRGFLPHPKVTEWIKDQAIDCFSRAGWANRFTRVSLPKD